MYWFSIAHNYNSFINNGFTLLILVNKLIELSYNCISSELEFMKLQEENWNKIILSENKLLVWYMFELQ